MTSNSNRNLIQIIKDNGFILSDDHSNEVWILNKKFGVNDEFNITFTPSDLHDEMAVITLWWFLNSSFGQRTFVDENPIAVFSKANKFFKETRTPQEIANIFESIMKEFNL